MSQSGRGPRGRAGAVFHRCALQVNPASYAAKFRGAKTTADANSHANAIVAKAEQMSISVLAITNHNSADDVGAFQEAAQGSSVTIFPGFEIPSSEGVHILCIYPPEASAEQLARYLGELGIRQTTPSSDLSSYPLKDVLAKVKDQGGISIAAHATNDKGLLKLLVGQARMKAWCDPNLLAIQIPGSLDDLSVSLGRIVRGENPEYRRSRQVVGSIDVAVINAKDVMDPDDLEEAGATVEIKMSKPSIEGLRQAFLDAESRIRLNSDASTPEHAELVSIEWRGGFLDGVVMPLHANLNVAIGGRGAGKSTLVESIRYALDLTPVGDAARQTHEGIVRHVLRHGTKIVLRLRARHPTTSDYLIERTVPNPPIVRESSGELSTLTPSEVVPNIEVYGQHEISEIAASRDKRVYLLDRFAPREPSSSEHRTTLRRALARTRQSIVGIEDDLSEIDAQLGSLTGLEEALDRYKKVKLDDKLKERTLFVREERILQAIEERFKPFRECLEVLQSEIPIDRAFLSSESLSGLPSNALLAEANQPLQQLDKQLDRVARQLRKALEAAEATVEDLRGAWRTRREDVQEKYEAILRDLGKTAVVAEEYIEIQRQLERLAPLKDKRKAAELERKEQVARRRSLCVEWEDLKAREVRRLNEAADFVNRELSDRVRVNVVTAADRTPLTELLRRNVSGRLAEALRRLEDVADLSLPTFVDVCRQGEDMLAEQYDMPRAQARLLSRISSDLQMRIEELELGARLTVELNTARSGATPSWQDLDGLSKGQKATAILMLVMLEPEAPLIIDQPEDDLDNRFITERVVPMIRDAKRRRQFVMATHNANIPVLGDAELIVGLTPSGEAGDGTAAVTPKHIGSIDEPSVRELVEEVLEGGRHAFETRRVKYGF